MKKSVKMLLSQGFVLLTLTWANAQQITDVNLKNAILAACSNCLDNNGNLLPPARTITRLDLTTSPNTAVRTSKGLEGFTNVSILQLNDSIRQLIRDTTPVHKLDSFPPNIYLLNLGYGKYEKINKLPLDLIYLYCGSYIDSIFPTLPKKLEVLSLSADKITSLPRLPDSLKQLLIGALNLRSLPELPKTLSTLFLSGLFGVGIYNTQLTSLPTLPPNISLIRIVDYANLANIPNLPNSLRELGLYRTGIKCLPILPNGIQYLTASQSKLTCIPNIPTSLSSVYLTIGGVEIDRISDIPICTRRNSACQYPAYGSGRTFFDANGDGIKNGNEPNLKGVIIKSTDNSLITLTDSIGRYDLVVDTLKTYTFSPIFSNNYFKTVPISRTITTTNAVAQRFDSLDFAIQSLGTFPDIATSITSGDARPGFNSISTLTYKNVGTTILNGTITLTLDAKQTFVSADVTPTQNGNVLTWNYASLMPFDFKNINITLKTVVTAPLSSVAISTVNGTITGATDANPLNNSETTQITVRGSYDPNDKQVDKIGVPTVTAIATTPLTYTIRFQNTGNAEAIRVEVVDTLTKKLDITTIEMLGASHPYEMKIVSDSGKVKDFTVVKWTFDGIYLPDSTSNEKASHGFIKYRIKNDTRKMGLTMDSILNKAAIYFDFNKPIITNFARTLFNPRVATVELKDLGLTVFPNPVSNVLTINSTQKTVQELVIDVVNTNGQVLMHQILRGPNPQINVQDLTSGLYFLKIKTAEGMGIIKIMKQ